VGASGGRLSIELGGAGRSHGRASEHSVSAAGQARWVKEGEGERECYGTMARGEARGEKGAARRREE
jgi:hypothetical protein